MMQAAVIPNSLFSDNAILQRDRKIPVWGTAIEGEHVQVEFAGQKVETVAKDGQWIVWLKPLKASKNSDSMIITGNNVVIIHNVLVGDVWLCSGQSNMEWCLANCTNGVAAMATCADNQLRLIVVPHRASDEPVTDAGIAWKECSPATVKNFSGAAYFFGRDLRKSLDVPVGLIGSYWGGTPARAWTDRKALAENPDLNGILNQQAKAEADFDPAKLAAENQKIQTDYDAAVAQALAEGKPKPSGPYLKSPPKLDHRRPGALFNGMVAPLLPYAIRGVIWYQGEQDNGSGAIYQKLFPALIASWRTHWKVRDLPFLFCQLAPYKDLCPEIREAQFLTWKKTGNTAMVVTTDVGNAENIHPRDKEPVGHRLALAARVLAYGESLEYSGPEFTSMSVGKVRAVLHFKHTGKGLMAKGGDLEGFTIAGTDKVFWPAKAVIQGDTVEVSCEKVSTPVAVRYGWANVPEVNLYNQEGLPASPFRTDSERN